jgi:hypothetical protein
VGEKQEFTFIGLHWKKIENPYKVIEWKLYGPLVEIAWILMIHNNCIFPYYGYSIEIVWIYYGFSGAIANFKVWISLFSQCYRTFKNVLFREGGNLPRVPT